MRIFIAICLTITLFSGFVRAADKAEEPISTIIYVNELTCFACLFKIRAKLQEVSGVKTVDGNVRNKMIYVDHDPVVTAEKLAEIIKKIGYSAEVMSSGKADPRISGGR